MGDDRCVVDEVIHLAEHDPEWSRWFVDERDRILEVVTVDVVVEHIGSTAVPGLLAKPIVDVLVGVAPDVPLGGVSDELTGIGYEPLGTAGVPGRLHLRRRADRSFNVSVVHLDTGWRDNLQLRDHLRLNPAARERYAEAKRQALRAGHTRLLPYSDAKHPVVRQLLAEAKTSGSRRTGAAKR